MKPSPGFFRLFAAFLLFTCPFSLTARSYSPWVVSEHVADLSGNWHSFMQHRDFIGKRDGELAYAVWKYLCSRETGLVHTGPWEEPTRWTNERGEPDGWGNPFTYGSFFDPVKNLNCLAMGYCGMQSSVVSGIFMALGYEARNVNLNHGYSHEVCEVFYAGGWHFVDTDERGLVLTPGGELASWEQMAAHPEWWPWWPFPDSPHFPSHLEHFGGLVKQGKVQRQGLKYRWAEQGHTMDFVLRMGETFTRFWKADSTRFYTGWWERDDNAGQWLRDRVINDPEHMYRNGQRGAYGSIYDRPGGGVFVYEPQLGSLWQDYLDGFYERENVEPADNGVKAGAGGGWTAFELWTPYIIVGKNGPDGGAGEPYDGALIEYEGTGGIRVLCSWDFGSRWDEVSTASNGRLDVTSKVYGRYGYLVKFEMAEGAALEKLRLTTWVQCAPVSLPAVRGKTVMRFRTGDRTGEKTVVAPFFADFSTTPDSLKALNWLSVQNHNPFDLHRRAAGASAVVSPPAGAVLRWLTVGGDFDNPQKPEIWVSSTGDRAGLKNLTTLTAPAWCDHWMSTLDQFYGPPDSIPGKLLVEYRKNVNNVRIYGHYAEPDRPVKDSPVEVTHRVAGVETTVTVQSDTTYTVWGEGENEWIRMRVKSERAD